MNGEQLDWNWKTSNWKHIHYHYTPPCYYFAFSKNLNLNHIFFYSRSHSHILSLKSLSLSLSQDEVTFSCHRSYIVLIFIHHFWSAQLRARGTFCKNMISLLLLSQACTFSSGMVSPKVSNFCSENCLLLCLLPLLHTAQCTSISLEHLFSYHLPNTNNNRTHTAQTFIRARLSANGLKMANG